MTRPIFMDKMDQVLGFPLTLISASAGFGKTALLIQWISGHKKESFQAHVA